MSPRLQIILDQGIEGGDFWDVCCDHGYLGEQALASGRFAKVHFVDCVPHIMASLKFRLGESGANFLSLRAEELSQPIRGTVVLAGVGGFTLIKILQSWEEKKVLQAERIVLNPLTHVVELRQFLEVWPLYKETETLVIQEKSKQREILVLQPSGAGTRSLG